MWTHMTFQGGNVRFAVITKFAITSITDSLALAVIPNKSVAWISFFFSSFIIISSSTASIIGRPGFFNYIGGIGCSAPVMAIGTYLCIYIEIIHQHKFICNRMIVGSYFLSENT